MSSINIKMIKDFMSIHHLSVFKFCERAKISVYVYRKIMSGKTNFRYSYLVKVADLLSVPFSLLLGA